MLEGGGEEEGGRKKVREKEGEKSLRERVIEGERKILMGEDAKRRERKRHLLWEMIT